MSPPSAAPPCPALYFPRVSGDEPYSGPWLLRQWQFSPCERG